MCLCNSKFCFCRHLCKKWWFSVFVVLVYCLSSHVNGKATRLKREDLNEVQKYLGDFGYLPRSMDGAFALRTEESIRQSLRKMQEFAGLPVTGHLDKRTIELMRTKRCGVRDVENDSGRQKRFALRGPKWPYTNLTWSVRQTGNLNQYDVRGVIAKALAVWSKHSQLTFTEVNSDKADILIYFYSGDHGDSFPFDGPGVVLAHAFFPTGMKTSVEVHFDADENWSTDSIKDRRTNLFNVAAHEIGHSLGLSHSNVESALMYPWYKEIENGDNYELPDDDKQAIQYLYGARDKGRSWDTIPNYNPPRQPVTTTTTTTTTTRPTTNTPRPRVYVPSPQRPISPQGGRYPYHHPTHKHHDQQPMHPNKKPYYPKHYPYVPDRRYPQKPDGSPDRTYPDQGYPSYPSYPTRTYPTKNPDKYPQQPPKKDPKPKVPKEYPTLKPPPDTCDTDYNAVAVIRREVFIFKDAYFWRIGDNGLMPGYPAEIRRLWHGLPENLTHVDAVYERSDGRIVFFIGDKYYVFSSNVVERGYPKSISNLGVPREVKHIDGAMVWGHNGKTYFYSGDMYWRFDEDIQKVELDYPRDMSMWKGVGKDIDAVFQWKDGRTYFFKGKYFWKFNDLHMRVEHIEPKLSAPFWMGCTTNYEENDLGQKLPYKGEVNAGIRSEHSHYLFISLFLIFYIKVIC